MKRKRLDFTLRNFTSVWCLKRGATWVPPSATEAEKDIRGRAPGSGVTYRAGRVSRGSCVTPSS